MTAREAYVKYCSDIRIPEGEYVEYWKNMFKTMGFTISPVTTSTWWGCEFTATYMRKNGRNAIFVVGCNPRRTQGITIDTIVDQYGYKNRCWSENGLLKFCKKIDL